jgi:hypothetical protein
MSADRIVLAEQAHEEQRKAKEIAIAIETWSDLSPAELNSLLKWRFRHLENARILFRALRKSSFH